MTKRRQAVRKRQDQPFRGRQFTAEVILWAVRWYLMFPISYRDLELMLLDRGVDVDHTTIFRWIQAYAVELEKRIRPGSVAKIERWSRVLFEEEEITSQAATWNSPAMNSAWALMSLPLMFRTCPFLIIAIAS